MAPVRLGPWWKQSMPLVLWLDAFRPRQPALSLQARWIRSTLTRDMMPKICDASLLVPLLKKAFHMRMRDGLMGRDKPSRKNMDKRQTPCRWLYKGSDAIEVRRCVGQSCGDDAWLQPSPSPCLRQGGAGQDRRTDQHRHQWRQADARSPSHPARAACHR